MPRLRVRPHNPPPTPDPKQTLSGIPDIQVQLPDSPRVMPTEPSLDTSYTDSFSIARPTTASSTSTFLHPSAALSQLSLTSARSGSPNSCRGSDVFPPAAALTETNFRLFKARLNAVARNPHAHPSGYSMRPVNRKYKYPIHDKEYDMSNYLWWHWRCCNDRCGTLNTYQAVGVFVRKEERVRDVGDGYDERFGMGEDGVVARTKILLEKQGVDSGKRGHGKDEGDGGTARKDGNGRHEKTVKRVLPYIGQECTRCGHPACRPYVDELPGCALVEVGKWVFTIEGEPRVYGEHNIHRVPSHDAGRPADWAWQWWKSEERFRAWEGECGEEEKGRSLRDDYYVYTREGVKSVNKPWERWVETGK